MGKDHILTPSTEDYLKAIFILDQGDGVRSVDVAQHLGVAKPSVNHAVNTLVNNGLATQKKYGQIYLTQDGLNQAKKIYEQHTILKMFLKDILNVEDELAEEEACSIEHLLSHRTVKKIKELTQLLKKTNKAS